MWIEKEVLIFYNYDQGSGSIFVIVVINHFGCLLVNKKGIFMNP